MKPWSHSINCRAIIAARLESGLTQAQLAEKHHSHSPTSAAWNPALLTPLSKPLEKVAAGLGKKLEVNFVYYSGWPSESFDSFR